MGASRLRVKTRLNSTLDGCHYMCYERSPAVDCKGWLDKPQRQPGKCGERKCIYIILFFRNVKPGSWVESCRSSAELAGLIFKISWVWGRRLPRNVCTSLSTTRNHTTNDNKLKIPHTEIFHHKGARNINSCIIFRLKDVSTVAKWIQLPGISLEYLTLRLSRMEAKNKKHFKWITNQMQQFFSLLSWRLFTAQHVSGVFPPIIRSSTTAVAASGFTFVSRW